MLDTDDISTSVAEDNGTAPTDVYDRIAQLAKLAAIPYQLERKKAAKTMGLTVTALDSAVAQKRRDYYAGETHPDALWHTPEGEPWATIGGWHFPVRSSQFRSWLTGRLFQTTGEVSRVQVDQLVEVYAAEAVWAGPEHPVHLRSAKCDGAIWLDLADEKGRAVRIDADGWRVVEAAEVPVKFRRPPNLRPLPEPLRDEADVSLLALLLNVGDPADWRLVAVWLSNALLPDVAYPILAESGKPGAAKTTAAMGLRQLIDPNAVPLCDTPRNRDDLKAHAKNNAMIAYDNLSGMPGWLADDLCRVATGGGLGGRRLYTDDDDAGFNVKRPVIINGVNDLATRGDLADRAVLLTLEAIPDTERRTDAEMDEAFQYAQPRILAGLLDMAVMGLRRREAVAKQRRPLPRMADFALWGMSVAPALGWTDDEFMSAYRANRRATAIAAIESDPVARAVLAFLDTRPGKAWEGTTEQLWRGLWDRLLGPVPSDFPRSSTALGKALSRLAPVLERAEVRMTRGKHTRVGSLIGLSIGRAAAT